MTSLDKTTQPQISGLAKAWQRTPVFLKAISMIALVGIVGANGISVLSIALPMPVSLIAMLAYLFLYWKFFSGSWGLKGSAETRKQYFRSGTLSPTLWKWSLILAALIVVVFQSSLVVTFRLITFPAENFLQDFGFESQPLWIAWVSIIIVAISAGLTEESGFRGYGMVPLQKRYGPIVANLIISAIFVLFHLNQAWAPPLLLPLFITSFMLGQIAYTTDSLLPGIIAHTVLDVFNFSYWWTDVAGKFEYQPIGITGVDAHFLVWSVIFAASLALFLWGLGKVKAVRSQS